MGKIIPDYSDEQLDQLNSSAEARLYRALRDQLSDDYLVLFQVGWILKREDDQARDGETDFLVAHPRYGYLCIEVKGGGIHFDGENGHWSSIDRHHVKHAIKDPIRQALRAKYSVLTKMKENLHWRRYGSGAIACGHAVFFPDLSDVSKVVRADLPELLIGASSDLNSVDRWVRVALEYWINEGSQVNELGMAGIELIKSTFAYSFHVTPLASAQLVEQERQRITLTEEQFRILDMLRSQRRVSISGGAGTGKTVLAVEKAKRLAAEGFLTLLTCYNRQLAEHLADVCRDIENLDVMSFHQLCYKRVKIASEQSHRNLLEEAKQTYPGMDLFDVHYPAALTYSLDIVQMHFDAIVCDEGQDFREEYWFPVEMLLSDYERSPLYIFFDENQNVYSRVDTFPIEGEPYYLLTNCRNTDQIHAAAYQYYGGDPVRPPGIDGEEVQRIEASRLDQQAQRIHARIVDLVAKEMVAASDIVVLVTDGFRKDEYYGALTKRPLPKSGQWNVEGRKTGGSVLVDTVKRFKGLESPIVFLWGLDRLDLDTENELIYVGLSRAKSLVYVVSNAEILERTLMGDKGDDVLDGGITVGEADEITDFTDGTDLFGLDGGLLYCQ